MTSKESSPETVKPKKNKMKGGVNVEIDDKYLEEILHIKNLQLELAMQIISNAQTVGSKTVQDLKEFNSQSLWLQAKKRNSNKYISCLLIKKLST